MNQTSFKSRQFVYLSPSLKWMRNNHKMIGGGEVVRFFLLVSLLFIFWNDQIESDTSGSKGVSGIISIFSNWNYLLCHHQSDLIFSSTSLCIRLSNFASIKEKWKRSFIEEIYKNTIFIICCHKYHFWITHVGKQNELKKLEKTTYFRHEKKRNKLKKIKMIRRS